MEEFKLELYWNDIPIGKENALTYDDLCYMWQCDERKARQILHELSRYDDGTDFVLIRSSGAKGFYKTDDKATIRAYREECLNRGKNVFAPLKKINRVLSAETFQFDLQNNLRLMRTKAGLTLTDVAERMKEIDEHFDKPMLSRMENNRCLPTYIQLAKLAELYGCNPTDLVDVDFY